MYVYWGNWPLFFHETPSCEAEDLTEQKVQ